MESAKKQNSSHDELSHEFVVLDWKSLEEFSPPPAVPEVADSGFSFDDLASQGLLSDPGVQQYLEAEIRRRVEARLPAALEEERNKIFASAVEEGKAEGKAIGLQIATDSLNEVKIRLNELADTVMAEKLALIKDHEQGWSRALLTLIQNFKRPYSEAGWQAFRKWLESRVERFALEGKIRITLSEGEYAKFSEEIREGRLTIDGKWSLQGDPSIADGNVRMEAEGLGVEFNEAAELQKLADLIQGVQ